MPSVDSPVSPAAVPPPNGPASSTRIEVGAVWRGYRIEQAHRAGSGTASFLGRRASDDVRVMVHSIPTSADTPQRREVSRRLGELSPAGALALLEAVPQADGRVEVYLAPTGPSLAEWLGQRDLEPERLLPLAQQLVRALLAVHERGLVYLRLAPSLIYFTNDQLESLQLGHLDDTVALGGEALVALPNDPHLVPPEGVGITHLAAQEPLKAWDWWTLGRVIQEMALGKPIAVHLLQREVPRDSGEARLEAEALLNEGQAHNLRPGAVEAMPALDPSLTRLLRGLLTGPRDARWGARELQAWLAGENPAERYDLPRGSVLFPLGEERLTLPEIALRFGEADQWAEGVAQFAAKEPAAGSVVEALLASGVGLATEKEWFTKVGEFREAASMRPFNAAARNEVLAAVAWMGVAPAGTRLRWKGRGIDLELLRELASDPNGLERMRVLCSRTIIDLIQPRDGATARGLRTWGFDWDEAFVLTEKHRWAPSSATRCRLAANVFSPAEAKAAALKAGRERFHLTSVASLQSIFSAERLSSGQLGLVAYTLERPEAFGYITHANWWKSEEARLRSRGEALLGAMRSVSAVQALRVGLPVSCARASWWTTLALVAVTTAVFWPGVAGALCAIVAVLGLWILRARAGTWTRRLDPPVEDQVWRWAGVTERLRVAAAKVVGLSAGLRIASLRTELAQINRELTQLAITPAPTPVVGRTGMLNLWCVSLAAWLIILGAIGTAGWNAVTHHWTPSAVLTGWTRDVERITAFFSDVELPPPPPEASDEKPAWPFVSSGVVHPLEILGRVDATERQLMVMKSFLLTLQEYYDPASLRGIVAAPVPSDDPTPSLMVIDVATGQLMTRTVYRVAQPPVRQMTVDLDGIQAMYLDGP